MHIPRITVFVLHYMQLLLFKFWPNDHLLVCKGTLVIVLCTIHIDPFCTEQMLLNNEFSCFVQNKKKNCTLRHFMSYTWWFSYFVYGIDIFRQLFFLIIIIIIIRLLLYYLLSWCIICLVNIPYFACGYFCYYTVFILTRMSKF